MKRETMGQRTIRKPSRRQRNTVRVLFTCVGRRVELLAAFRLAAEALKTPIEIHGADANQLSPAMHHVDRAHLVPRISSRDYIGSLLEIVGRRRIDLLIPLLDPELPKLASAVDRFAEHGCCALVSSPSVIKICRDKLATFKTLKFAGIDTPQTWTWDEAMQHKRHRFPYFLKPRRGSAAMGNHVVNDHAELKTFGLRVRDPIVQEFVEGVEHTLDVYTGFDGTPRCVVPRRRMEVRTGEVSKALIVKDPAIMEIGRQVAEVLVECRGVVTVQCMVTRRGRICVIEINPRFGGGVPLAIHAGADFPKWIISQFLGRMPRINPAGFRNDVAMLRFDDSVFVENASKLIENMASTRRG
jgi:carbamoyl-phosphate synthase large subunit